MPRRAHAAADASITAGASSVCRTASTTSPRSATAASTASGLTDSLAPPATTMEFSPSGVIAIMAVPVATSPTTWTAETSTPTPVSAASCSTPTGSSPTAPTKHTLTPARPRPPPGWRPCRRRTGPGCVRGRSRRLAAGAGPQRPGRRWRSPPRAQSPARSRRTPREHSGPAGQPSADWAVSRGRRRRPLSAPLSRRRAHHSAGCSDPTKNICAHGQQITCAGGSRRADRHRSGDDAPGLCVLRAARCVSCRIGATQEPRTVWTIRGSDLRCCLNQQRAPEGIRTPNLLIRSQMLYPLSYGRSAAPGRTMRNVGRGYPTGGPDPEIGSSAMAGAPAPPRREAGGHAARRREAAARRRPRPERPGARRTRGPASAFAGPDIRRLMLELFVGFPWVVSASKPYAETPTTTTSFCEPAHQRPTNCRCRARRAGRTLAATTRVQHVDTRLDGAPGRHRNGRGPPGRGRERDGPRDDDDSKPDPAALGRDRHRE